MVLIAVFERGLAFGRAWSIGPWLRQVPCELYLTYALAGRLADVRALLDEANRLVSGAFVFGTTLADLAHAYLLVGRLEAAKGPPPSALLTRAAASPSKAISNRLA
jgi:hypothetical protein